MEQGLQRFPTVELRPDAVLSDYASRQGQAIVIDCGSYLTRAGWSGTADPHMKFASMVGKYRAENAYSVGNQMVDPAKLICRSPFDVNVIVNYDLQEVLLDHVFETLGVRGSSVAHPIVMTEPVAVPSSCRAMMSELLFETYGVPSVCYGVDSLFSMYQNNVDTALCLSSSYFTTHFLPVVRGQCMHSHIRRSYLGGYSTSDYMLKLMHIRYLHLRKYVTPERAEYLKENACYVALNFEEDLRHARDVVFQLDYGLNKSVAGEDNEERKRKAEATDRFKEFREARQEEKKAQILVDLAQAHKELTKLLGEGVTEEDSEAMKLRKQIRVLEIRAEGVLLLGRSLLNVPDEQLNELEIAEKKRQKFKEEQKKAREQKLDPAFVESLVLQRNAILERKVKEKARGGRKSTAAQERLQTIASAAFEEPSVKRARKAQGKKLGETEDDNFGENDADWDVYLKINKEVEHEDEADELELHRIEEQLQKLAPEQLEPTGENMQRPRTREELQAWHQLRLGTERFRVPEVLFQPSLIGVDVMGFSETMMQVFRTAPKVSVDQLSQRVFLTGGNTMFPQLAERLAIDLQGALPSGTKFEVLRAKDPLHGAYRLMVSHNVVSDAWRGAAKWARSAEFSKSCVTRRLWEESGAGYVREHFASNKFVVAPPEPT